MNELRGLWRLARELGVSTRYTDGLKQEITVSADTLVRVCRALGADTRGPGDAAEALRAMRAAKAARLVPPVIVAWNGALPAITFPSAGDAEVQLTHESGGVVPLIREARTWTAPGGLEFGYHRLSVRAGSVSETATVIAAPMQAYRRDGTHRSWGVGTQLAALRSVRSRSVGDLADLESLCGFIRRHGGDLVTVLPLLPTFNEPPAEPSPYSPVSRLFWSELMLELGEGHRPTAAPAALDVSAAAAEVRAALAGAAPPEQVDPETARYARFRGAQARMGRNWRDWPAEARNGVLTSSEIDSEVERFHLVAQTRVRRQLADLRNRLDQQGMRIGLDLAVGVHPDGYDPWSQQQIFADGMSVGAPPDEGFPSGQDWGFSPVLPDASQREGHRYIAASIGHQASLAGVLRVDHIMAWTRLYWIPHGMSLHEGTYVSYPADELFAVLALESNRHRCEVVGENLGNVPPAIDRALPRHRIWGMYLAEFQASDGPAVVPPDERNMALIGTHDTPTFAGWLAATDVAERVRYRLLAESKVPEVIAERARAAGWLAATLDGTVDDPQDLLIRLLDWLGSSDSPLVVPWLEDLWLEDRGVNLPGTPSSLRPNWQRPMARLLDQIVSDPSITALVDRLNRHRNPARPDALPAHS
jgi:4-alpha-glucanotransferase